MRKVTYLVLAAVLAVVAGCASAPSKPEWIMKGSGAFPKEKKVLYGVGIAEGISSEALRRTTADNRALADVSKQLSAMSTVLMRDYMSSTSATEEAKTNGEQYVENTAKTFASNTVSGARVVDRWDDGKTTYSLCELRLDELKTMVDQVKQLSTEVREYIKANAEQAFDKLESEQDKRGK